MTMSLPPSLTGEGTSYYGGDWDNPDGVNVGDIASVLDEREESEAWEYSLNAWLCSLNDGGLCVIRSCETGTCEVCGGWSGTVRKFAADAEDEARVAFDAGAYS
jgi:hypothetical protein